MLLHLQRHLVTRLSPIFTMSFDFGLINEHDASQNVVTGNSGALRPSKLVPLSAEDWQEYQEPLKLLFENRGWTAENLEVWMKSQNRQTS
jgi:hypothetical protein